MDRGERRRRDENYARWLIKARPKITPWFVPDYLRGKRLLGLRKSRLFWHHLCSKKRKGQPKIGRGCKYGPEMSPKVARYQQKYPKSRRDLDTCQR